MFGSWIFTQNIFSSKNHFVGHICALITSFLQIGIHEKKWFIHKRLRIKTNLHQFQMQFLFYQIVTSSSTKKNRINTFLSVLLLKSKTKGQPSFKIVKKKKRWSISPIIWWKKFSDKSLRICQIRKILHCFEVLYHQTDWDLDLDAIAKSSKGL